MSKIVKELYSMSIEDISSKFKETQAIINLSKDFSYKAGTHIKILANLVNSLIDSSETLVIKNRDLVVNSTRCSLIDMLEPKPSLDLDKSGVPEDENPLNLLIENFKRENEKLWQLLEKGDRNIGDLKAYVEKLIVDRTFGTKKADTFHRSGVQKNTNNINTAKQPSLTQMRIASKIHASHVYTKNPPRTSISGKDQQQQSYKSQESRKVSYRPSQVNPELISHNMYNTNDAKKEEINVKISNTHLLDDKIRSLMADKEASEKILADNKKELDELKNRQQMTVKQNKLMVVELLNERSKLITELSVLNSELLSLSECNTRLDIEIKTLLARQEEIDAERSEQYHILKASLDITKENPSNENDIYKRNTELELKIIDLESKLADKTGLEQEIEYYQYKFESLNKQIVKLRAENHKMIKSLNSCNNLANTGVLTSFQHLYSQNTGGSNRNRIDSTTSIFTNRTEQPGLMR